MKWKRNSSEPVLCPRRAADQKTIVKADAITERFNRVLNCLINSEPNQPHKPH